MKIPTKIDTRALAEAVGVSVHTVRSWRQGRREPCCKHQAAALKQAIQRLSKKEKKS